MENRLMEEMRADKTGKDAFDDFQKEQLLAKVDGDNRENKKGGFLSKLAFWRAAEGRSQRTEDEGQKSEGSGQRTEDREPQSTKQTPNGKIEALAIGDETLAPAVDVLIRPGYIVNVLVMASGRKEVDESQKRVSAEGHITLPLVGRVEAAGLTMLQLSDKLVELYSKFLREPMVDVDFVLGAAGHEGAPWGFVTVLGRVKQPGRVAVPPTQDLTLSTAIQMAGGFDKSAKKTGIKITREKDGKTEQMEIDLQSIGDAGKTENDVSLLPGDFVFVPERFF